MQMADGKLQSDCTLESPAYRDMNTRSKMSGEGGGHETCTNSLCCPYQSKKTELVVDADSQRVFAPSKKRKPKDTTTVIAIAY